MEICVIQNRLNKKTYGRGFSFGFLSILKELLYSGARFNQIDLDLYLEWLEDEGPEYISWYYVDLEKEDGFISMCLTYTDKDLLNTYIIEPDLLTKVLKDWVEVIKKNPREIILIGEGDTIRVEGRHFESSVFDTMKLSSCKFTKESEEKLFGLKSKKVRVEKKEIELFEGGFHFFSEPQKYGVEVVDKRFFKKKVSFIDFTFKDNFYINHALFPADWSKEKIKESIFAMLQRGGIERIEVKNKILSISNVQDNIDIRVIINNNCEILTAYPIY